MLSLLVVVLTFIAVASRPTWRQLDGYSFTQYVADFNIDVEEGSASWVIKKALFEAELARVQAHNAKGLSWKEGINQFSALTTQEKNAMKGRSKGAHKNHKPVYKKETPIFHTSIDELPSALDWRDARTVGSVKDQGNCGSCWAFASTATIESHAAIASGILFDLSPQQMTMCAANPDACGGTGACQGSTAELAFDYVAGSSGMVQEYQVGYEAYYGQDAACSTKTKLSTKVTIDGYVQLPTNNYTALLNAVATVGPISVSVDASWGAYEEGIFSGLSSNPDIDHAVVLVGYGHDDALNMDYWLIRNSWAPSWGEKGYIRLARSADDESMCALDTTPQDGVACAGDTEPELVCGTSGVLFDSAYPVGAKAK